MKIKILFIRLGLVLSAIGVYSCDGGTKPIQSKPSANRVNEHLASHPQKQDKITSGTFEFIDYNDNGDYTLLNAKKGNMLYSFINDRNEKRDLLRGDLVEITRKMDTIYIAGDGETPELAEWIVSVKKVGDGNLSTFRKTYKKSIRYSWCEACDFTDEFKDKLSSLVEYYLANAQKESIRLPVRNRENLSCSIEKQPKSGYEYIALGISSDPKNSSNVLQLLFYHPDTDQLFEYDLQKDKLVKFN